MGPGVIPVLLFCTLLPDRYIKYKTACFARNCVPGSQTIDLHFTVFLVIIRAVSIFYELIAANENMSYSFSQSSEKKRACCPHRLSREKV